MEAARKKVIILGYVALVLCVMAVTASFAWMSISSTPTVTDLALSVVSDNAMEVAPDENGKPGTWSTILDLSEITELNAPLKPVTFSAKDSTFYAPHYGLDGRTDFSSPTRLTDENGNLIEENNTEGCIYSASFWIRANASYCSVALTPAEVREGEEVGAGTFLIGEPVWNAEKVCHEENGNGAEKAVRIMIHADATDAEEEQWILYEPSVTDGQVTESIDGGNLEGNNRLIRQKASVWKESTPILKDTVIYNPGEFLDNTKGLFTLQPGISRKITVFIWLEGQDADCTNAISGGSVFGNLQFSGEQSAPSTVRPE